MCQIPPAPNPKPNTNLQGPCLLDCHRAEELQHHRGRETVCVRVCTATVSLALKTRAVVLRVFVFPSYWQSRMFSNITWPVAPCSFLLQRNKKGPSSNQLALSGSDGTTWLCVAVFSVPCLCTALTGSSRKRLQCSGPTLNPPPPSGLATSLGGRSAGSPDTRKIH